MSNICKIPAAALAAITFADTSLMPTAPPVAFGSARAPRSSSGRSRCSRRFSVA
jgi:hypothetical protein